MATATAYINRVKREFGGRVAKPLDRKTQAFIVAAGLERFSIYAVVANCDATYSQVAYLWRKAGIKVKGCRDGDNDKAHRDLQKLKAPTMKVLPPEYRRQFVNYAHRPFTKTA